MAGKKAMDNKGFTLIELVMILVLIGIIAAVAVPRLGDVTGMKSSSFADKLRADIRYAQNLAMTENQRYRVYVNIAPAPAPAGYAVANDTDGDGTWGEAGEFAADPAGSGNLSITLNAGEYAGITVAPNTFVEFDALGRPTVGGGTVLTLSPGGATITITAQTGALN